MKTVRYAYALTSALLLGGTAASLTMQNPATAQVAQNEPGAISAQAPRAGAPMSFADMVAKLQPAVVNISTTQRVTLQQSPNPFAGTPFGELFGQFGGGQGGQGGAPVTREGSSLISFARSMKLSQLRIPVDVRPDIEMTHWRAGKS